MWPVPPPNPDLPSQPRTVCHRDTPCVTLLPQPEPRSWLRFVALEWRRLSAVGCATHPPKSRSGGATTAAGHFPPGPVPLVWPSARFTNRCRCPVPHSTPARSTSPPRWRCGHHRSSPPASFKQHMWCRGMSRLCSFRGGEAEAIFKESFCPALGLNQPGTKTFFKNGFNQQARKLVCV